MNDDTLETIRQLTKPVRFAATAALGALALFLLALAITAWSNLDGMVQTYPNTITVEGTGTGTAIPDIATVSFSITERAETVAAAQTAATAKMDAALSAVEGMSIEEKDVKTISYNVYPQYENIAPCYGGICETRNPRIIGYEVSQTVEVKIRDTAKAGDVLQALGSLEVQNISGPNFTVDEDEDLKSVAREEAIENAKAKAKVLADKLGVRLGKVTSYYENTGMYGEPYYYGKGGEGMMDVAVAQSAPALPTGEQETTVSISITYEIH